MVTVSPCLWFDNTLEEAVDFYVALFPNSKIIRTNYFNGVGHNIHGKETGEPMTTEFELEGQRFLALNGGKILKMNPSISMSYNFESKEKLRDVWEELSRNGRPLLPLGEYDWCPFYGWVEDRFGLSWHLYLEHPEPNGQKIIPILSYAHKQNGKAEEAMRFYADIFKSPVLESLKFEGRDKGQLGHLKLGKFKLNQYIMKAMDSHPSRAFDFNESVSLIIECDTQQEIDLYWNALTKDADPNSQICGWLKDRYGVSWQVVPRVLFDLESDHLSKTARNVTEAIFRMKKFNLAALLKAAKRT